MTYEPNQHVEFSALPTEIVVATTLDLELLLRADELSLVQCQMVCKLFNSIIKESSEIQYQLALFFGQKLDGPPSRLDPTARLKLLQEHEARWTTLDWKRKDTFSMIDGSQLWELAGGIFAQALPNGGGIRCREMPSVTRGVESHTWDLTNLDVDLRDFGMSPAEDLLVMVERGPHRTTNAFVFSYAHLRTGAMHPRARLSQFDQTFNATSNVSSYDIQILDDTLAILMRTSQAADSRLIIWDWPSGSSLAVFSAEDNNSIDSFALLSTSHVVISSCDDSQDQPSSPSLDVYEFRTMIPPSLLCCFTLPPLVPPTASVTLEIRAEPLPSRASHPDLPFFANPKARLCILNITIVHDGVTQSTMLFRLDDLYQLALKQNAPMTVVPWDRWSSLTRWFDGSIPATSWVVYMHSSRLVMPSAGRINVIDFNPWTSLRRPEAPAESRVQDVDDSTKYENQHFEGEITTSLPYRATTNFVQKRYTAIMIDEEHLYGMIGMDRQMDVFTF